jgi:hypothetical protein
MTNEMIGLFIGLESSSYEYIANIIAPYQADFSIELGSFLLIDDNPKKLVARVIDFVPQGELTSFMGQKWLSDVALLDSDAIGSDIKKRKISYRVKIKILGNLDEKNKFNPGLRKIPHITSKVSKASSKVMNEIINEALEEQNKGKEIGSYFLDPGIKINFDLSQLNSKRTFIFARAGYGKTNLMKLLASSWDSKSGGLIVFDPDGEYALTDKQGRPGILDKKEAILITNRKENKDIKNIYRNLKINLKTFSAGFVAPIVVPAFKQEGVFFNKLRGLKQDAWNKLVDLLYDKKWNTPHSEIKKIIQGVEEVDDGKDVSTAAIINNLVPAILDLHDPSSHLMNIIEQGIKKGATTIFDISLLGSKTALHLSSIVVRHILNKNQKNFVEGSEENLLKATFVVDEAQSVLSKEANVEAFVELAKEGRKYQLGGVFITQQPGSIIFEILSQGDNFFVFHLLSKGDLNALQSSNAHYSNDVVTQILNEPIRGKCYMWTSHQPFVLPVQILNFEDEKSKNKAKEVQSTSTLLESILKEVDEKLNNPTFKNIIEKYKKINNDGSIKDKTATLFKELSNDEKEFIRKEDGLQQNQSGVEFAVKSKYYGTLLVYDSD